jgi:hypothetical protein
MNRSKPSTLDGGGEMNRATSSIVYRQRLEQCRRIAQSKLAQRGHRGKVAEQWIGQARQQTETW